MTLFDISCLFFHFFFLYFFFGEFASLEMKKGHACTDRAGHVSQIKFRGIKLEIGHEH